MGESKGYAMKGFLNHVALPRTRQCLEQIYFPIFMTRAEGIAEGIAEGGNLKLYELVQKGRLTLSEGADEMGVSEDDFVSRMSLCGYHLPKNEN